MKNLNQVMLFIICLMYFSCVNALSLRTDIDAIVTQAIQEKRIVGAVVLIYQDGKPIYRSASGFSDRENSIPMTDDTIFRFSSLSKAITTIAVLKLIDAGQLNLNDPVTKWLPQFMPKANDGRTPIITIQHLLTHTSGLSMPFLEPKNGPYHQLGISDGLDKVNFSLAENIQRLGQAPLLYKPGRIWNYSLSTDVLGLILAEVTGKPLPDIIDELVLIPLGMTHTGFLARSEHVSVPYADNKPEPLRMMDGYEMPFGLSSIVFYPSRIFDTNAFPSAGGSLSGTADDYLKLLEGIRLGTVSLKKETLEKLTTNQIGMLSVTDRPGWGWSLGFAILKHPLLAQTPQAKGTYEWGGIWGHTWWVDPTNKLTVVILTNTAIEGLMERQFANDIRNAIYADIKSHHL